MALAMFALVVVLVLRKAEAQVKESLRGLGHQIAQLDGLSPHSAPRKLTMNGLEFGVVTAATSMGVSESLNRFQSLCRTVAQVDFSATVRRRLEEKVTVAPPEPKGVIRQDGEEEGFLACLDLGAGVTEDSLLLHLVEFGKTGNLQALGQLRYALARRSEGVTTLLMLWTEGDAKLTELFPKIGDAPGRDLWELPRPKDSRRILSAFEGTRSNGLASYEITNQLKRVVVDGYRASLREQGWHLDEAKNGTLIAEKAGRTVLVRTNERRAGRVVMSFLDLG